MPVNEEFSEDFTENDSYEQRRLNQQEKRTRELQDELDRIRNAERAKLIVRYEKARHGYLDSFLDKNIDLIEEMIFDGDSTKKIAASFMVPHYRFFMWTKKSIHKERIDIALEYSSESHMTESEEILRKSIADPRLTMQQAGLIRELALHLSRKAGFRDPKKFGRDFDKQPATQQTMIVSDQQMSKFIEATLQKKRLESGNLENMEDFSERDEELNENNENNE